MMFKFIKSAAVFAAAVSATLAVFVLAGAFLLPEREVQVFEQQATPTQIIVETTPLPPEPELLGTATTTFWGSSADRIHNIALGAKRVSSVTVKPGEEYSFLEHLGDVSLATGYKKEAVISNGSTVKEAGGGICQVSTTLFRAAVDAGLPITERTGHGYIVGYYGPGLDATIYGPWRDLKFMNDTGNPITIQSTVVDGSINFAIFGIPDGRTATTSAMKVSDIKPPPPPIYISDFSLELGKKWCPESPVRGMKTEVMYTITRPDGTVEEQLFESNYKAWGKKCYMGVKLPATQ